MPAVPFIIMAGTMAASAAANRSKGRAEEASYLQKRDAAELERAQEERREQAAQADREIVQRQKERDLRMQDADQAVRGGKLQGTKDIEFSGIPDYIKSRMPTVTGGARPSAITGKEEIGKALQERAMSDLLAGKKFEAPALSGVPGMSTPPQPGKLDKFLNILGTVGSVVGGANAARNPAGGMMGGGPSYIPPATQIPSGNPIPPGQVRF